MSKVTLSFTLPEERSDLNAALYGQEALCVLFEIDNKCRSLLKYGTPSDETRQQVQEIRELIPFELLQLLE
jgi:hypothetical protein